MEKRFTGGTIGAHCASAQRSPYIRPPHRHHPANLLGGRVSSASPLGHVSGASNGASPAAATAFSASAVLMGKAIRIWN